MFDSSRRRLVLVILLFCVGQGSVGAMPAGILPKKSLIELGKQKLQEGYQQLKNNQIWIVALAGFFLGRRYSAGKKLVVLQSGGHVPAADPLNLPHKQEKRREIIQEDKHKQEKQQEITPEDKQLKLDSDLIGAVYGKNFQNVQNLIAQGASSNAFDGMRRSALCFAVVQQDNTIARFLVERGAAVDGYSSYSGLFSNKTPFHLAAECGDLAMVEYLLDKGACLRPQYEKRYYKEDDIKTVVWDVAKNGHVQILEFLFNRGITISEVEPVLFYEVACQGHVEVLRFLISKGISAGVKTVHGTALHGAASKGNVAAVKFLVEDCELDINESNENFGDTPLHKAVDAARISLLYDKVDDPKEVVKRAKDVVSFLISKGANCTATNLCEQTPIEKAVKDNVDVAIFKELFKHRCNPGKGFYDPGFYKQGHNPAALKSLAKQFNNLAVLRYFEKE